MSDESKNDQQKQPIMTLDQVMKSETRPVTLDLLRHLVGLVVNVHKSDRVVLPSLTWSDITFDSTGNLWSLEKSATAPYDSNKTPKQYVVEREAIVGLLVAYHLRSKMSLDAALDWARNSIEQSPLVKIVKLILDKQVQFEEVDLCLDFYDACK